MQDPQLDLDIRDLPPLNQFPASKLVPRDGLRHESNASAGDSRVTDHQERREPELRNGLQDQAPVVETPIGGLEI